MSETQATQRGTIVRAGGAVVDQTLRIIELDGAFAGLADSDSAMLIGRPISDLSRDLEKPLRKVLATGQVMAQVPLHARGNGSILLRLEPLRTTRGTIAGVELRIEPAAPATIEAELRFQSQLLDAVGLGVIATDIDGTIRYWNRFAEQLYGWTHAEALGRNILELITTDLSLRQGREIMARLQTGQSWSGQYTARRRDGSTFPAFVSDTPLYGPDGTVTGIVGISTDISDSLRLQSEREEALRREQSARAQADEALALLDTLFNSAPVGICFLSPDYRYLRINEALAAMNGLPVAAHLGRNVHDVLPELAQIVEPIFKHALMSGEPIVDLEINEEHPDEQRERRIWRASYYPVRLSDGQIAGLGIVANDITTYRRATDALRLSEERFRVALQNSPIFVYTTDRELRYTWIYNTPAAFAREPIIGRHDAELLPADEAAKLTIIKQRVLDREYGEREEVQLNIAGELYVYDLTVEPLRDRNNAVVGLTVAAIDITARRRAELALRESEARYSALAEAVPAILFTNQPDGTTDYISQNYYDFTGTERGSNAGTSWAQHLHPDDRERTVAAWQAAIETGRPILSEYRFRRHDGVYRWFRVQSQPLRGANGAVVKWFGISLDIDDAKHAAAEREELLARERAAVEARDNFIAIASHDLRSPLAALLGQVQLLQRQAYGSLPESMLRRIQLIGEQTRRLNRMIGALLDISRIESGQLTIETAALDLGALAARVVSGIQSTVSQCTLKISGETHGFWVVGDEIRLEHVIFNLIDNAIKYGRVGGEVTIRLEQQDGRISISVTDSGIGIPAAALPRLFERYFRAANVVTSGMGIGLYAVREIVMLHGGTVAVVSEEGIGSTFTVSLPRISGANP